LLSEAAMMAEDLTTRPERPVLATLIDRLPDPILAFDLGTMHVVDASRDAFGYSREELLLLDAFALFPRWWNAAKGLDPGATVATFCREKDGTSAPVEIHFARARFDGAPLLVASVRARGTIADVERELAETNAYLHAIVENIPDMIFVKDAETHAFRRFNRAGEELLGFTRGELLGKTDHDFYPKKQADFFRLKDEETLRAGKIVDIPAEPIDTKYKGQRILHTRKIPVMDARGQPQYLLGISEDITERMRSEQMIRELADIVRYLRDAVVTWRPDGTVASWNPGAERLYGVTAKEAIGKPFARFLSETDAEEFGDLKRRLLDGEEVGVREAMRLRADGREIEVEESLFAVLDAEGRPQRIASIARDMSEAARWRRATQVLSDVRRVGGTETPASPEMQDAVRNADLVAEDANATVLILGETGVGKSWLARRIHRKSPRAGAPFFEINCAGLAGQLVESELFGHERGAFTGATFQKRGLVETAEGGTLFLDEVGDLSLSAQAQLLTFIDTRTFRRVGGNRALTANVRLIAATNADLKLAVDRAQFRRDLFYRLSVVPIFVPPLRERPEEVADMAASILLDLSSRAGKASAPLAPEVLGALERYAWPGNIRELRNTLERALILSKSAAIRLEHLPAEVRNVPPRVRGLARRASLDTMEREHIMSVLAEAKGNRTRAADVLGISRSTLKRKLAEMRRAGGLSER
jgi:PAS domain S-box-containing protein